jgi:hypothetical protein
MASQREMYHANKHQTSHQAGNLGAGNVGVGSSTPPPPAPEPPPSAGPIVSDDRDAEDAAEVK